MGECKTKNTPLFQNTWSQNGRMMMMNKKDGDWIISEEIQENSRLSPTSSSSHEASTISNESSSLSSSIDDISDDASSSLSSCVSSSNSNESLYDLTDLMAELPIKRGLSKFYQGKSESFTCLARVTSVEDLPKKVVNNPYKKRTKSSKSYGGLDNYKTYTLPKRIISKRGSMGSLSSSPLISPRRSILSNSINSCNPPLVQVQKNMEC
ncbi:hypothetical protein LIER_13403 [Lithospermum erythrorhizon]|uniref:Uncharacterized protein n=1 Tax=Lithospermum erythrorhizon TaxID=34254 RepID=A0AAV3PWU1_LITER